jgi:uncharacterized repeat protein (TIGR02543 family)
LIIEPTALSKAEITRSGYHIEGWYRTKTQDGDEIVYSDKWDFETDKVDEKGVTLYAKWKKNIYYTYDVCYLDKDGEVTVLGSYEVDTGDVFDDYLNFSKKRYGFTALGYRTADGKEWDTSFTHPGGEESLTVQVFVEYIEGNYSIVSTASELKKNKKNNIYLTADIDFGGEEFGFDNYNKTLIGNGHTISNFKLQYQAGKDALMNDFVDETEKCLCISLFGNTKDATIENVKFENVTIEVSTTFSLTDKIYVAPLAVSMTNTKISGVTFTGTIGYIDLPKDFVMEDDLKVVTDAVYYKKDEKSTVETSTVNVAFVGKIEEE